MESKYKVSRLLVTGQTSRKTADNDVQPEPGFFSRTFFAEESIILMIWPQPNRFGLYY